MSESPILDVYGRPAVFRSCGMVDVTGGVTP